MWACYQKDGKIELVDAKMSNFRPAFPALFTCKPDKLKPSNCCHNKGPLQAAYTFHSRNHNVFDQGRQHWGGLDGQYSLGPEMKGAHIYII